MKDHEYCDKCYGDGASWLQGRYRWAVKDIHPVGFRNLCSICRQYPDHNIKAVPLARALQQKPSKRKAA